MESKAQWQIRATQYEFLAHSFLYPDGTLAEALASGEWQEAAAEIAEALELELGDEWEAGLECYAAKSVLDILPALRAEATHLFVGAPEPAVSPCEGIWRASDDGVQPLLFVNPYSMAVERFMRSCGIGRPKGTNEPLDQVSTECEFMQYLASLEGGLIEPSEMIAITSFPGGSPGAAYKEFYREHLAKWIPCFAEMIISETEAPYYRSAARVLKVFVEK